MKLKDPDDLSIDELSDILKAAPLIEAWLNAIAGRVDAMLRRGVIVPGFKLVIGRAGNREWDVAVPPSNVLHEIMEVTGAPLDTAAPRQLLSPTEAERLYKAALGRGTKWKEPFESLSRYVSRAPGKLTLAPTNDPRPEVRPATTEFLGDDSL